MNCKILNLLFCELEEEGISAGMQSIWIIVRKYDFR